MCDSTTSQAISDVVTDFVNRGCLFTAFDVTKATWAKLQADTGLDPNERWPRGWHTDIKGDIHRALQPYVSQGVYEREMRNVAGVTGQMPFIYFPTGSDPAQYDPAKGAQPASVSAVVAPTQIGGVSSMALQAPPQIQTPSNGNGSADVGGSAADGFTRGLTPYNRLCVPNAMMRKVGFQPGDNAYLLSGTSGIEVVKTFDSTTDGGNMISHYVVDEDCNIRVMAASLAKGGLDTAKSFKFEGDSKKIVILNA